MLSRTWKTKNSHYRLSIAYFAAVLGPITLSSITNGFPIIACRDHVALLAEEDPRLIARPAVVSYPFLPEPNRPRIAEVFTHEHLERLVLINDDPLLQSSVLTATPETFETASEFWVMLGGMGGDNRHFNVVRTGGQFANTILNRGGFPIVIRNGVYYGTGRKFAPPIQRRFLTKIYSRLSLQTKLLGEMLVRVVAAAGTKPVYVLTRSNGTGLLLQLLSDAARGDASAAKALKGVSALFVAGLNSPEPELFEKWTTKENLERKRTPEKWDLLAIEADRKLYRQMTWTSPSEFSSTEFLPPLVAIISAADEYIDVDSQVRTMEQFANLHSSVSTTLVFTDLPHNPMSGVRYKFQIPGMVVPRTERAHNGHRFWEVVEATVKSEDFRSSRNTNIKQLFLPGYYRFSYRK